MKFRHALAATAVSVSLVAAGVSGAAAVPADPSCSITPTGSMAPGIQSFSIKFTKTCGYNVRTFIHYNDFPYGTHYEFGNTVEGFNVTSSQLLGSKRTWCTYGWQYQNGSKWANEVTGGSGC